MTKPLDSYDDRTSDIFRHTAIRMRPDWRESEEAERRAKCKHKKVRLHRIAVPRTMALCVRCIKCGAWWDVTKTWPDKNKKRMA